MFLKAVPFQRVFKKDIFIYQLRPLPIFPLSHDKAQACFFQYEKLLENIKSNPFLNFILKSKQKSRTKKNCLQPRAQYWAIQSNKAKLLCFGLFLPKRCHLIDRCIYFYGKNKQQVSPVQKLSLEIALILAQAGFQCCSLSTFMTMITHNWTGMNTVLDFHLVDIFIHRII